MGMVTRSLFLVLLVGVKSIASSFDPLNVPELIQFLSSPFYIDNRIVGGQEANIEDYPHQVSFIVNDSYFCGGFIVSENYILTAGHCAQKKNGTIIPIAEVIPHPMYDDPAFDKDVAVMKTVEPIQFTDTIQPIALPPEGRPMVGRSTINVSGWGRTKQGASSIPERLMEVSISVVNWYLCKASYGILTENEFCAGNFLFGGKGTCQGDSGGTAIQDGMAVGIVSFGRGCGQILSPSVFADIAAPTIRSFIYQHTNL